MDMSASSRVMGAEFDPQGLADFLRRRHSIKTAYEVEAKTGLPHRTIERWLAGTSIPSARALARLTRAYGPALLAAAMPGLAWLDLALVLLERATMLATAEGMEHQLDLLEARQADLLRALTAGRAR